MADRPSARGRPENVWRILARAGGCTEATPARHANVTEVLPAYGRIGLVKQPTPILLVGANRQARVRLAYALRFDGHAVIEAGKPAEARALVEKMTPALVIIDDPKGDVLAGELRARPGLESVPIVLALEVVRPCPAATVVVSSPVEAGRVLAFVRERAAHFAPPGPASGRV